MLALLSSRKLRERVAPTRVRRRRLRADRRTRLLPHPNSTVARMSTLNAFGQVPVWQHTCAGVVLPPAALDFPTNVQISPLGGPTAGIGARSVAASYKPPMLVTRVRLPACACVRCTPHGFADRTCVTRQLRSRLTRAAPRTDAVDAFTGVNSTFPRQWPSVVRCGTRSLAAAVMRGERSRGSAVRRFSGVGRANADYLIPLPQYRRCIRANSACARCLLCCGEPVQPSTASARRRWATPHARADG